MQQLIYIRTPCPLCNKNPRCIAFNTISPSATTRTPAREAESNQRKYKAQICKAEHFLLDRLVTTHAVSPAPTFCKAADSGYSYTTHDDAEQCLASKPRGKNIVYLINIFQHVQLIMQKTAHSPNHKAKQPQYLQLSDNARHPGTPQTF